MKKILIWLLATSIIACNNSANQKEEVTASVVEQLTGEWNNLSIRVEINSKNNADSNEVFEVGRPQWEEKLKIKPIRTFFRADSTWNSAHYNLKDSLVYDPSGKWWIERDKLTMLQLLPSSDTTVYDFTLKNGIASFKCMLDWDMDGEKDDQYFGIQRKVISP
ncbi:MAG TPA: hypothetical protein VIZ28_12020 [Chitinophagaceae bacterium]